MVPKMYIFCEFWLFLHPSGQHSEDYRKFEELLKKSLKNNNGLYYRTVQRFVQSEEEDAVHDPQEGASYRNGPQPHQL